MKRCLKGFERKCIMKNKLFKLVFVCMLALTVVPFGGCGNSEKLEKSLLPMNEKVKEKFDKWDAEYYDKVTSLMIDKNTTSGDDVVQEYIILHSFALFGYEFIDIRVFDDMSGELTRKFFHGQVKVDEGREDSNGKGMVFNETVSLDSEQTKQFIDIFEDNGFWDIPAEHPEELLGSDGNTIEIEGFNGEKYNIISMWHPKPEYEIRKIYDEIIILAETIGVNVEFFLENHLRDEIYSDYGL